MHLFYVMLYFILFCRSRSRFSVFTSLDSESAAKAKEKRQAVKARIEKLKFDINMIQFESCIPFICFIDVDVKNR